MFNVIFNILQKRRQSRHPSLRKSGSKKLLELSCSDKMKGGSIQQLKKSKRKISFDEDDNNLECLQQHDVLKLQKYEEHIMKNDDLLQPNKSVKIDKKCDEDKVSNNGCDEQVGEQLQPASYYKNHSEVEDDIKPKKSGRIYKRIILSDKDDFSPYCVSSSTHKENINNISEQKV